LAKNTFRNKQKSSKNTFGPKFGLFLGKIENWKVDDYKSCKIPKILFEELQFSYFGRIIIFQLDQNFGQKFSQ